MNIGVDVGVVVMLDFDIYVRDGFVSVDVDNLVVECDIDIRFGVGDVFLDEFVVDIYINWLIIYFFGKLVYGFL